MESGSKLCTHCKKRKPLKKFVQDLRCANGRGTKCQSCVRSIKKAYYKKYPLVERRDRQRMAERSKAWYEKHRAYCLKQFREKRLMRQYGITQADYRKILASQNHRCAICGTRKPGREDRHFKVDHDHKTGRIRGLLCHLCNVGLGSFRDDLRIVLQVIRYLRKSR